MVAEHKDQGVAEVADKAVERTALAVALRTVVEHRGQVAAGMGQHWDMVADKDWLGAYLLSHRQEKC